MMNIEEKLGKIRGIGLQKSMLLSNLSIETYEDALNFFPRDYEHWNSVKQLSQVEIGKMESFVACFIGKPETKILKDKFSISKWEVEGDSRSAYCIWFNQPFRLRLYKPNITYFFRGKMDYKFNQLQIQNPIVEEFRPAQHTESKILPIYPLTKGITQKDIRNLTSEVLNKFSDRLIDNFDDEFLSRWDLVSKSFAYKEIHFPSSESCLTNAKKRLVFEEFFALRLALCYLRQKTKDKMQGIVFEIQNEKINNFYGQLPFGLTKAQKKAIDEVFSDFQSGYEMNRLIQGDVGSGKTVVAAAAIYCAFLNGFQSTIMVPTEILARQHLESFKNYLSVTGLKIACLTGSCKPSESEAIKRALLEGEIDLLIGTHSLIEEDVKYKNLALVITDEQHRFGVRQRRVLQEKGLSPHVMVMSATPIPRTVSLMFYGDLDISIINELPPGRKMVKTFHVPQSMRGRVLDFVKKQVIEGRQAFIVCPLIEESEQTSLISAIDLFQSLKDNDLSGYRLGLLHGKMLIHEKDGVMQQFLTKQFDVLISTTVIEVGVNISNASIIVIENAERFGLAQLHQLRGRVGRGQYQSYCVLISDASTPTSLERMKTMTSTDDGFEIANMDLKLRGSGDYFGTRQHGLPEFKIASLVNDAEILNEVNEAVDNVLNEAEKHKDFINKIVENFNKKASKLTLN